MGCKLGNTGHGMLKLVMAPTTHGCKVHSKNGTKLVGAALILWLFIIRQGPRHQTLGVQNMYMIQGNVPVTNSCIHFVLSVVFSPKRPRAPNTRGAKFT